MLEATTASLLEVTSELYEASQAESKAKARKDAARKRFLALATQAVGEEQPLRKKTVSIPEEELSEGSSLEEEIEEWRQTNEPAWRVVTITPDNPGAVFTVVLEEDPALIKFSFVNTKLKKVFGRTTEERGAYFDAEGLHSEMLADSDLRDLLGEEIVVEKTVYELDELRAQLIMSLHPDAVPALQRFAHSGQLNAKLTPVRAAKEEEVE